MVSAELMNAIESNGRWDVRAATELLVSGLNTLLPEEIGTEEQTFNRSEILDVISNEVKKNNLRVLSSLNIIPEGILVEKDTNYINVIIGQQFRVRLNTHVNEQDEVISGFTIVGEDSDLSKLTDAAVAICNFALQRQAS